MIYNNKFPKIITAILLLLIVASCGNDDTPRPIVTLPEETTEVNIDLSTEFQTIRGFGGINHPIWRTDLNATERELVFGTGEGQLGFSILRIHVDPNPNNWDLELPTAQHAINAGAIVFASPWDPPAALLDPNNNEENKLLPENYGAYVDHLNDFNTFMDDNGVPLYAISIQNEPDIGEWTQWTSQEILTFMQENAQDIENRVIAPESFQFRREYSDPILNDPVAVENVDIIGGHIYGGGLLNYPLAEQKGKEIWMTEYLLNQNATPDWSELDENVIWGETMEMLNTMHESMTLNWNTYLWWYIQRYYSFIGDGDQGTERNEVLKRGYAFSHFSRFVRPGYVRVGANIKLSSGTLATAYTGDNKTVLVMLNPTNETNQDIKLSVDGEVPASANIYTTSVVKDVEQTTVNRTDDILSFDIPAQSVVTVIIEN